MPNGDYEAERDSVGPTSEELAERARKADEAEYAMQMYEQQVGQITRPAGGTARPPVTMPTLARLQGLDRPGTRTISVRPETDPGFLAEAAAAQRKFESEKMYRFFVNNGMAPADAMSRSGLGLFTLPTQKPMTAAEQARNEIAQAGLQLRKDELAKKVVNPLSRAEEQKLSDARRIAARARSDLVDPMKRMSRPVIEKTIADTQDVINQLEQKAGIFTPPTTTTTVAPPAGTAGSSRSNPAMPKTRKEAEFLPKGTWVRDPAGNVFQKK